MYSKDLTDIVFDVLFSVVVVLCGITIVGATTGIMVFLFAKTVNLLAVR